MFFNSNTDDPAEPIEITLQILKQLKIGDISNIRLVNSSFNKLINAENQKLIANRIEASPYYRTISNEALFNEGYDATALSRVNINDESDNIIYYLRIVGKYYYDADSPSTYIMRTYQIIVEKDGVLALIQVNDQANGLRDREMHKDALLAKLNEEKTLSASILSSSFN